jgi:hypothetical protein
MSHGKRCKLGLVREKVLICIFRPTENVRASLPALLLCSPQDCKRLLKCIAIAYLHEEGPWRHAFLQIDRRIIALKWCEDNYL